MTGGLILAGGASSRMGRPKALLRLGEWSFLERLFQLLKPHCSPICIVTGFHHEAIAIALPKLVPLLSFNPIHPTGMFSSIRHGLQRFPLDAEVLLCPVDFSGISARTIEQLLAAPAAPVVKPRFAGHSGHPVLLRPTAIQALLAAPAAANAKEVLAGLPQHYVDVDDAWVARDCDTPEEYERFAADWLAAQ